jgi:hypothetical protein
MSGVKYPDAEVRLSDRDGNIGSIMGRVNRALRDVGVSSEEQNLFRSQIFGAESYDDALRIVMRWVSVQ